MAAGDQFGCKDLMRATIPDTWGQAIEVPDRNSYESPWSLLAGVYAAKMSTPGAAMSGYHHESDINDDIIHIEMTSEH
jgi:hypothetical protein